MVNCVIPTTVDNFLESDLFEFLLISQFLKTVVIAQLVRASDCGSEGRGFEPHWLPEMKKKLPACGEFSFFSHHTVCQKLLLKASKGKKTILFALFLGYAKSI